MGLWLAARSVNRHVGKVMFGAVAVFGLANLVFALSHWFVLSMLALAVAGAADMVSVFIRGALVQFSTPDSMRGRVNAVNMLFIGSSNELGEFRAGSSAAWFGAVPAAMSHDELEFLLPAPVPEEKAMDAAVELYGFCPDVIDQGPEDATVGALADVLRQSTVWYFWWD